MTILGDPSVAELRELVAAYDYQISRLAAAFVEGSPGWIARDIASETAWVVDFQGLQARYEAARAIASATFDRAKWVVAPDTAIGAPLEWQAVVRSFRQRDNETTRGDFRDLTTRLYDAGVAVSFPNVPQPRAASDLDLRVFKATDAIIREVESTTVSIGVPALLIGAALVAGLVLGSRRQ